MGEECATFETKVSTLLKNRFLPNLNTETQPMQLGVLIISTAAQEEWGQREPHKHKASKSQMISLLFGFF